MANRTNFKNYRTALLAGLVCGLLCCFMFASAETAIAADGDIIKETLTQSSEGAEKIKAKRDAAQQAKSLEDQGDSLMVTNGLPENISLPEDTTALLDVGKIEISGNEILTTEQLLKNLPSVYNSSYEKIEHADPIFLYDFRSIKNVLAGTEQPQKVSARTIRGLTEYLLSVYQRYGHAGVYVYVPAESFSQDQELTDGILRIQIVEATVAGIKISYFDVDGNPSEKQYLKAEILEEWSPVKAGEPIKQNELDEFLNLLNLNPDRYITATVSKGEGDTLEVDYKLYEVSPWHYFAQIDNAGTKDRRWSPRIGFINTNLTGRDDTLTAVIQGPIDDRFSKHNYSAFVSYDVPLFSPKLRLNMFGGRSEFDIDGGQGIDFLGNGTIWGGTLTYNLLQKNQWFFDIYGGLSFEKSKVSTSLFSSVLGSKVTMALWSVGAKLHKTDDMSRTTISIDRTQRAGGSSQSAYTKARAGAKSNFWIWTFSATRYQYLDREKIQRVLGSIKYVRPNGRLIPAKMTTFGGMYTVRGYRESAIVADGGVLASFQYEYDLVKHAQAQSVAKGEPRDKTSKLRKLAPLVFLDYGRADVKSAVAGEKSREELLSIGAGVLVEWGKHLSSGAYYGHPLMRTSTTRVGDGRINIFVMLQW